MKTFHKLLFVAFLACFFYSPVNGQIASIPSTEGGELSDDVRIEILERLLEFKNGLVKKIPDLSEIEEGQLQKEIQSKDFVRILKARDTIEFSRKFLFKNLQEQIRMLESIKSGKKLCDSKLWKEYLLLVTNANYVAWLDKAIQAKFLEKKDVEIADGQENQAGIGKNCLFEVHSILECFSD